MENGKGTAREKELLAATDVAGMIGVKETTIYRWCKEGKLPCLKVGKHWRIERVMNSIRNGLGMQETEIAREPS